MFLWRLSGAAALLVVALGATMDFDSMPTDIRFLEQEHNYIDPAERYAADEYNTLREVLLARIFNPYDQDDFPPGMMNEPKWISNPVIPFDDSFDFKGSVMKRAPGGGATPKPKVVKTKTQRYKGKKVKPGSQLICYFKICAFRPMY